MQVDLVVTTRDRPAELERLLGSLLAQTHRDLAVIVTDQSDDDASANVLAGFTPRLRLTTLRSAPGAARGRNAGLAHVSADIVGFPDDDCWYPPRLLEQVVATIDGRPDLDGLLCRWVDPDGDTGGTRWDRARGPVDRFNVWNRGNTASTFLRRHVVDEVGTFDERLGVGSDGPWQSGEETDYLLRALRAGFRIEYEPSLELYHPDKARTLPPDELIDRGRRFARGMGRVLALHGYPRSFVARVAARAAAASARELAKGDLARSRYHLARLRGLREGWRGRVAGR